MRRKELAEDILLVETKFGREVVMDQIKEALENEDIVESAIVYGSSLLKWEGTPDVDMWNLPGGKVEKGESLIEALEREVKEEVNAEISNVELCRYEEFTNRDVYTFNVELTFFKFKPNSEAKSIHFFDISDLPKNLYDTHLYRIFEAFHERKD